jgi:1,4-dihydroxy-2-naphthoyl-CoA synthase
VPTESRVPAGELLLRVQQRIKDGRLPVHIPPQIYAGHGTGRNVCGVCDQSITANEAEYEVTDPRVGKGLHFHFNCYFVWQHECTRLQRSP